MEKLLDEEPTLTNAEWLEFGAKLSRDHELFCSIARRLQENLGMIVDLVIGFNKDLEYLKENVEGLIVYITSLSDRKSSSNRYIYSNIIGDEENVTSDGEK